MKTRFFNAFTLIFLAMNLHAQEMILPLYPEGEVPNYRQSGEKEIAERTDALRISYVQTPDINVFLPAKKHANGKAVVITPGGGYWILAYDWEGTDIAKWLNSKGIAAIVLKYRLPVSKSNVVPHESPLMDAQRAMKMVRHNASEWNIDPDQVGIMGFSAGGHLASTLSTRFDEGDSDHADPVERLHSRPDFSILVYPVISSDSTICHQGSFHALLGDNPDPDLLHYYSNEKHVHEETPPTILIHSADDKGVPYQNSLVYFEALQEKGISSELHIYPFGGHGYSLALGMGHLSGWPDRVMEWIFSGFGE
ncbi:MAG: alpha/beta hydrolase [Bacteroidota bacterium]